LWLSPPALWLIIIAAGVPGVMPAPVEVILLDKLVCAQLTGRKHATPLMIVLPLLHHLLHHLQLRLVVMVAPGQTIVIIQDGRCHAAPRPINPHAKLLLELGVDLGLLPVQVRVQLQLPMMEFLELTSQIGPNTIKRRTSTLQQMFQG